MKVLEGVTPSMLLKKSENTVLVDQRTEGASWR